MCDVPACHCADRIGELARTHARRLAALARKEGVHAADALDVVQDAFQTVLARPDASALCERADDVAKVLTVTVRNAARNARRRHHRARVHVELEEARLVDADEPEARLERATEVAQLAGCMDQLGDTQRQIVTLRVLEELSGDDAARLLGLSANHVAVLLHRARKELARCMLASA